MNGGEPVLDVWLGYTPLDAEQRTNRTFGYLSVKKPKIPGLIHAAWPFITWFTEGIFAQDKHIVEQEQKAHDAQGGDWNNEVFPAGARFARRPGALRRAEGFPRGCGGRVGL